MTNNAPHPYDGRLGYDGLPAQVCVHLQGKSLAHNPDLNNLKHRQRKAGPISIRLTPGRVSIGSNTSATPGLAPTLMICVGPGIRSEAGRVEPPLSPRFLVNNGRAPTS